MASNSCCHYIRSQVHLSKLNGMLFNIGASNNIASVVTIKWRTCCMNSTYITEAVRSLTKLSVLSVRHTKS